MHASLISYIALLAIPGTALGGAIRQRAATGSCKDGLTVKTTSGTVQGFINDTAPAVRQWLGVPYAEPPVGSLRFLPPKPKKDTGSVINATAFQPSCIQQTSTAKSVYTEYMPEFLINGGNSEDCLYINVYAPLNPVEEKVPVFIYIPGGGFTSGGANSLYKIPDKWINRTQTHIVVTMNYRLNIFGYPNARWAPLNAGLLDQRMVVEWARDNIAGFGGDPERMVLWGQSAGGSAVSFYPFAWPKDPIVTGLIADSGAANNLGSSDTVYASFTKFAGFVGCGNLSAAAELECMQNVPATTLQTTLSGGTTNVSFSPAVDNTTRFANTTDRMAKGLIADIPKIQGNNANEGAGFGTFNASGLSASQVAIGLSAIVCPVSQEIKDRAAFGLTTYRYYYSGNFSNISPKPWIGATHSSELPLVFGTHYEYRGNSTQFEWDVSYTMEALWLSFASNSDKDPRAGSVFWPRYYPSIDTTINFANGTTVSKLIPGSVIDNQCPSS